MIKARLTRGMIIAAGTISVLTLGFSVPASASTDATSDLTNGKSGKCMSVEGGGSTANGAHIIQWACNGGPEQQWSFNGAEWRNGKSGKCMSVEGGGSTAEGAHVIQWTCNGGPEQQWFPVDVGAAPYVVLVNNKSGYLLSVSGGGSTDNDAELVQWRANRGPEQLWLY